MRLDLDKSFKLGDDIVYRIVDDEAIVLDVVKGEHFNLNRTATEILKLIDQGKSLRAVISHQAEKYGEDSKLLESDLSSFVGELNLKGILVN